MYSKLDKLKASWLDGDYKSVISIASKFFDKSSETILAKKAQSAINNPSFYLQINKDPNIIVNEALKALSNKFNLPRLYCCQI